jgi:hypothetical protein
MKYFRLIFVLLLITVWGNVDAQKKNRIQPGRLYEAGETLYAPRFGFIATVPEGWEGMLPRENEVFLLTTTTSTYGEIYVFGRPEGNLALMADAWSKGFDLSETIRLKALKPVIQEDILSSEVVAEGQYINKGNKGFAITRCSPNGPCVTVFMVAPIQFYESVKSTVIHFMSTSKFEAPSTSSPYSDFDWTEFLSNTTLIAYAAPTGGSKKTQFHLCADGTFIADIKKTGFFKNQNPEYRGHLTGKWVVTGPGEETTIQFTFNKKELAPFKAQLTIKEEQVYSNGERYFVGQSDKCK